MTFSVTCIKPMLMRGEAVAAGAVLELDAFDALQAVNSGRARLHDASDHERIEAALRAERDEVRALGGLRRAGLSGIGPRPASRG